MFDGSKEARVCLAIPGKIVGLTPEDPHFAVVEVAGVRRKINVDLVQDGALGLNDWVLIHVGFAMSKISEQEAAEQMRVLAMLGEDQLAMQELEGYQFG